MSGFQLSSVEFFASLVVAISSHLCYAHKNAFSAFNWSTLAHSRRFDRYATLPLRTDRAWPRACHIATSNARRRKRPGFLVAVALGARSDQGLRLRQMTQIACTGSGGTPTGPTNLTGIYGLQNSGGSGGLSTGPTNFGTSGFGLSTGAGSGARASGADQSGLATIRRDWVGRSRRRALGGGPQTSP